MYGSSQRLQGPHLRLHDGHRLDARAAARRERDGQFRQGRAAAAGAHRSDRLRPRQDAAVHRPVGDALRARQRDADRARTRARSSSRRLHGSPLLRSRARRRPDDEPPAPLPIAARARPAVNPWLVAAAVVIPTFMEVLDTTIANVALRYIAGGLSAPVDRQRMGHHQLPRRQRDHPADLRLAGGPPRPAQLFSALDRRVHARLGAVRHGDEPERC